MSTGLTRVGGAGTLRFDAFAQIGDVEATNGTLSFTGGGLGTNPTIVTQAPGVIDFGNGFTLDNAVFPPSNSGTILGNFTLGGALTSIDSAMTFQDVAITTTGTLAINAPVTLEGAITIDGDVTNNDLLQIQGVDDSGPLDANVVMPNLNNLGTLRLTSTAGSSASVQLQINGSFSNSGTIEVLAGGGFGARTITAGTPLFNNGSLTVSAPALTLGALELNGGSVDGSGTLNLTTLTLNAAANLDADVVTDTFISNFGDLSGSGHTYGAHFRFAKRQHVWHRRDDHRKCGSGDHQRLPAPRGRPGPADRWHAGFRE